MACIDHPHIVTAHAVFLHGKYLYIVQDLAHGDVAREFRLNTSRADTISLERLVRWSHELVQGVRCLHRESITHGDIKASNLLLYPDDRIRLGDLSLAVKRWSAEHSCDERYQTILSTVTHRAPEVFQVVKGSGGMWSETADVWSIGCTLYEMAHGRNLWSYVKDNDDATYEQITAWALSSDRAVNPWGAQIKSLSASSGKPHGIPPHGIPPPCAKLLADRYPNDSRAAGLDDLIGKCLTVDPSQRPSARDLLLHPLFKDMFVARYLFRSMQPTPDVDKVDMMRALLPHLDQGPALRSNIIHCTWDILIRLDSGFRREMGLGNVYLACLRIAQRMCNVDVSPATLRCISVEKTICDKLLFRFLEGVDVRNCK